MEPRRLAARAAARRMAELLGEAGGRHRRLCDAHGPAGFGRDPHPGRHRRRAVADDPRRSGAQRRLGRRLRRVSRALARWRLRPGAGARRARRLASGPAAAGDVGHARRSPGGRTARRCARHRECRPGLPGRLALPEAASHADRGGDGRRHRRGSGRGGDGSLLAFLPGQREIERTAERLARPARPAWSRSCRSTANSTAGPRTRHPAGGGGTAQGRAGDRGRRDLAHHRRRAGGDRQRPVAPAALRAGDRHHPAGDGAGVARLGRPAGRPSRPHRSGRGDPPLAGGQTAALRPFTPPEILEADLAGLVLDCAAFGVGDPLSLAFLDPPPRRRLPKRVGCWSRSPRSIPDGRLTVDGAAMRRLALPVRLAHMVVGGQAGRCFRPRSSPCC